MPITDYISYDEVRTTCGLGSDELSDSVLALPLYESAMSIAAGGVSVPSSIGSGTLLEEYEALDFLDSTQRTTDQERFYNLAHMFLIYAVAAEVVVPLSMRAPKTRSDGKATITRFSPELTFLETARNIRSTLSWLKQSLENFPDSPSTVVSGLYVVSPETDVVTDE